VRNLRIWILLLLAVLLPLRGAVAAGMPCPAAGAGSPTELRVHDHAMAHPVMDTAEHEHADAGEPDTCNVCSAFCSVTPPLSSIPALFALLEATDVSYPDVSAPAASFLSDGQERPPRSI
jgi:hypothetical protein